MCSLFVEATNHSGNFKQCPSFCVYCGTKKGSARGWVGFSENYKYCPKLVQTTKASLSELEVGSGVSTAVEK